MLAALYLLPPAISQDVKKPRATPVREADQQCATCHKEIYDHYLETPMANASGLAEDKLYPTDYLHKPSNTSYNIKLAGSNAILSSHAAQTPGAAQQHTLSYFLGSGHLGITYLYSINDFLFESPIAWYPAIKGYDMKPGLEHMKQSPPALPMQSGCLRCHMSAVQPSDAGTLNRYKDLPFLHTGITCEACHGDTKAHLAKADKSTILNPANLSPEARDSICISCHLEGDITVERAGHSSLDYQPGEPISKYLAFYVYRGSDLSKRGVSEVEQLSQSRCKIVSGEKMSCSSCHDPHFSPPASQRTQFYRNKCLACHSTPEFTNAHHPEQQDCTSCHMAPTGAENIPHVAWIDHRILRVQQTLSLESLDSGTKKLVPIFSPGASARDQAMANYMAVLEGNSALTQTALGQLTQQRPELENDPEALNAFATLAAKDGDSKAAEQAFRRVLQVKPDNLAAISNLGTFLAKQGKLKEAASMLQPAFDRNQDVIGLSINVAKIQCAAGDTNAARNTLEAALIYNPDQQSIHQLKAQMTDCSVRESK